MNDNKHTHVTSPANKSQSEGDALNKSAEDNFYNDAANNTGKGQFLADYSVDKSIISKKRVKWSLLNGLSLRTWQRSAVDSWLSHNGRGIMKVVTGAGKTILSLAVAEHVQNNLENDLHVAIIVPSVVLANQWRSVLLQHGSLGTEAIGMLGGGHSDQFTSEVRILIAVLNSAAQKLPEIVRSAKVGDRLLLIVDECHRAGASERRKIFETQRRFSLGLSATPERGDEFDDSANNDEAYQMPSGDAVLAAELGEVVYQLNYAEAIKTGTLADFKIEHYGLALTTDERNKYDQISQSISDLRRELEGRNKRGEALLRWCRSAAGRNDPRAHQFIQLTTERKILLYKMTSRVDAVKLIIEQALSYDIKSKVIIFHESIEEVNRIYKILVDHGYPVRVEHSKLTGTEREKAIQDFRSGSAQIIVSAKSLIEGFDAPSADIGIIVAASSSVRQRIQTLGRLLRKGQDKVKQARLIIFYAHKTVDEFIYEKADWEEFVGKGRNEYYKWADIKEPPQAVGEPPRRPRRHDGDITPNELEAGGPYPGVFEGRIFSRDSQGNIIDEEGKSLRPTAELKAILAQWMHGGGRFAVTPTRKYIIRINGGNKEGHKLLWLGIAPTEMFNTSPEKAASYSTGPLKEGDVYPFSLEKSCKFSVLQRDPRLVALKKGRNVQFVVSPEKLIDAEKAERLQKIIDSLHRVYRSGRLINKILVTDNGDAVYEYEGVPYFIGKAPEGKQGFEFDS
ncbi:DEAD/DEAH box helicase [Azospirillum sp. SYSU D00513]|uniref:DEAD/DEAH box helicase n=1 Tax=Azospirillum sp. SYSU D00513 TaxID=2812561 RepID=UPI001A95CDA2|nr:DEAD/DEAH box helicase [Azospirillum sp. SYSU D00513]